MLDEETSVVPVDEGTITKVTFFDGMVIVNKVKH